MIPQSYYNNLLIYYNNICYNKYNNNMFWKNMNFINKRAFTLAEMMAVMMVLSLIMGVSLPVITVKIKEKIAAATSSSLWKACANNSDIYYGTTAAESVYIGLDVPYTGSNKIIPAKLMISPGYGTIVGGAAGHQHSIIFKENANYIGYLAAYDNPSNRNAHTKFILGHFYYTSGANKYAPPLSSSAPSLAIGSGDTTLSYATSIGRETRSASSVAIGYKADSGTGSNEARTNVTVGANTIATNEYQVAVGAGASTVAYAYTTALGASSTCKATNATSVGAGSTSGRITFGAGATGNYNSETIIGAYASSTAASATPSSTLLGYKSTSAVRSVIIGGGALVGVDIYNFSKDYGTNLTVIIGNGASNDAYGENVTIGYNSHSSSTATANTGSVVIGANATYENKFGTGCNKYVIIGESSKTYYREAVAIGSNAKVYGEGVSIGYQSNNLVDNTITDLGNVSIGNQTINRGGYSVAIGNCAQTGTALLVSSSFNIAIGSDDGTDGLTPPTSADGGNAIAIGYNTQTTGDSSIAIGKDISNATKYSIIYGANSNTSSDYSTVIGSGHSIGSGSEGSIAIGNTPMAINTNASSSINISSTSFPSAKNCTTIGMESGSERFKMDNTTNSVVLGYDSKITDSNNIVSLGYNQLDKATNCIIIGNMNNTRGSWKQDILFLDSNTISLRQPTMIVDTNTYTSDKRKKNIKGDFIHGFDKIKDLKAYHYSFKKDKTKRKHVGVIAQDLEKVFPDSVEKNPDGYLSVTDNEMFFAMINSIKEIDSVIKSIKASVYTFAQTLQKYTKIAQNLTKTNEQKLQKLTKLNIETINLEKQNEGIETQILMLEHKLGVAYAK